MLRPKSLRDYWAKVIVWLILIYGLYVLFGLLELPQWWNLPLVGLIIAQSVLIYRMLKSAGRSGGWLLIYLLQIEIGPSLEFGNRELFLGQLIYLVPIVIAGWPTRNVDEEVKPEAV